MTGTCLGHAVQLRPAWMQCVNQGCLCLHGRQAKHPDVAFSGEGTQMRPPHIDPEETEAFHLSNATTMTAGVMGTEHTKEQTMHTHPMTADTNGSSLPGVGTTDGNSQITNHTIVITTERHPYKCQGNSSGPCMSPQQWVQCVLSCKQARVTALMASKLTATGIILLMPCGARPRCSVLLLNLVMKHLDNAAGLSCHEYSLLSA